MILDRETRSNPAFWDGVVGMLGVVVCYRISIFFVGLFFVALAASFSALAKEIALLMRLPSIHTVNRACIVCSSRGCRFVLIHLPYTLPLALSVNPFTRAPAPAPAHPHTRGCLLPPPVAAPPRPHPHPHTGDPRCSGGVAAHGVGLQKSRSEAL